MAAPRNFNFRPGDKIEYTRDHPLPNSDEDTEVEYYEQEKETASDFELENDTTNEEETEDDERTDEEVLTEAEPQTEDERDFGDDEDFDGEDTDVDTDDDDTNANTANMANIPNLPVLHRPNQSNPLVPFTLAPGHVATDPQHEVICPECPTTDRAGSNFFQHGSMSLHFIRRHYNVFTQYYGVPPPARLDCPYVNTTCSLGPFNRQSDLTDHLSEKHNLVPPGWRLVLNKQKRRHFDNLMTDHVVEAMALNDLIRRIIAAEAGQPQPYASQHGLPLVLFEDDPSRITNAQSTVARKKDDLAVKLIDLRRTADRMGLLLGGDFGTWEQVAVELEARSLMSFGAPVAGASSIPTQAPSTEDFATLAGYEEGEEDAEGEEE
ncbi:hypothetical protein N0V93_000405 [Gnomoniopsis smithogilvyi]|uniref:Uncharacterized protein n=1 Tax=Gnomoniopsis smithogilvyi TaxID=1191159 RepID=A0A9W9D1Q0_9PEZI|nr:hypothetical protein N0V93_000405 [Gnomoniopsis smithogilvyi]